MKPQILVRRYPYEEPYHTQLVIWASNGIFSGGTDIYCGVEELGEIGTGLQNFPRKIGDEYRYEYGSEDPQKRWYRYFLLRTYTIDSLGHCAIQIAINKNTCEPDEGVCKFSINAEAASINRLGQLFKKLGELKHLEFKWSLDEDAIYEQYQKENRWFDNTFLK